MLAKSGAAAQGLGLPAVELHAHVRCNFTQHDLLCQNVKHTMLHSWLEIIKWPIHETLNIEPSDAIQLSNVKVPVPLFGPFSIGRQRHVNITHQHSSLHTRPASVPIVPTSFDTVVQAAIATISGTWPNLWWLGRCGLPARRYTHTCICAETPSRAGREVRADMRMKAV